MGFSKEEYEKPYHGLEPSDIIRPSQVVAGIDSEKNKTLDSASKSMDELIIQDTGIDVGSLAANVGSENDIVSTQIDTTDPSMPDVPVV